MNNNSVFFSYLKALPQAPRYQDELNRNGRIVGGSIALIDDVPYMVAILRFGSHICGGAILSVNVILTAAHCTE